MRPDGIDSQPGFLGRIALCKLSIALNARCRFSHDERDVLIWELKDSPVLTSFSEYQFRSIEQSVSFFLNVSSL